MIAKLKTAWRRSPVLTVAFVVAVTFGAVFAFRSVTFMIYWSDPAHQNQAIEGWMTPRYIAKSWNLPRDVLFAELGSIVMPEKRRSLAEIAAANDLDLSTLIEGLTQAAKTHGTQSE